MLGYPIPPTVVFRLSYITKPNYNKIILKDIGIERSNQIVLFPFR